MAQVNEIYYRYMMAWWRKVPDNYSYGIDIFHPESQFFYFEHVRNYIFVKTNSMLRDRRGSEVVVIAVILLERLLSQFVVQWFCYFLYGYTPHILSCYVVLSIIISMVVMINANSGIFSVPLESVLLCVCLLMLLEDSHSFRIYAYTFDV